MGKKKRRNSPPPKPNRQTLFTVKRNLDLVQIDVQPLQGTAGAFPDLWENTCAGAASSFALKKIGYNLSELWMFKSLTECVWCVTCCYTGETSVVWHFCSACCTLQDLEQFLTRQWSCAHPERFQLLKFRLPETH